MGLVLLGIKVIITIYIIINIIEFSIKNKTRNQYFLLVLLFVMLFNDLRALIVEEVTINFFEQLMLFVFLLYVSNQVIKNKNVYASIMPEMIDYKVLLSSEVMNRLEEGVALINADNSELLNYNATFARDILPLLESIGITEILSRVSRQENEVVFQTDKKRHVYYFRTESLNRRTIVLYSKDITYLQKMKNELSSKTLYEKEIWDELIVGVLLLDTSGHIIYRNPKIEGLFDSETNGNKQDHINQLFNKNSERRLFEDIKESLIASGNASISLNEKVARSHQPIKYYEIYAKVIDYQSSPTIFMLIHDQSEYKVEQYKVKMYNQVILDYYLNHQDQLIYLNLIDNQVILSKKLQYQYPELLNIEDNFSELMGLADIQSLLASSEKWDSSKHFSLQGHSFKLNRLIKDDANTPLAVELKRVESHVGLLDPNRIGQLLIKHIREGIAFISLDGKIVYANEIYAAILGYELNEIQGQYIQAISPETTEESMQRKINMTKQNRSLHYEQLYQSKKGLRILVEIVAMYVDSGEEEGILLLVKNKTQIDASPNVNVLATKYRQILDTLQDDIVEISLPNRSVSYYKNSGMNGEFIGKEYTFYQWLENVHLEDQGLVNEAIDNITSEKKNHYSFEFKYFVDGYWCWLRGIGSYFESDDEAYIMLLLINIDELKTVKSALDEYRMILTESEKVSVMAHWKFDVATSSFYIPENFKNLMAINNLNESLISYERFLEYLHPADRSFFEQKFRRAIWSKEELNIIVRVIRYTQISYIQIVGDIHLDEEDLPKYIIGNIMDITDRKQMEHRVKESRKLLQSVIKQSPTGIAVIKRSGKIEVINNEARRLINIKDNFAGTKDHIIKTIASYYQSESGSALTEELSDLFQTSNQEIRIKRIEGETQWLSLIVSPMKNEEDILTGHILMIIDLTETLSMKEHAEEQSRRLIRAENLAKLGHFEFEDHFENLYFSEMVSELFEIPLESYFDTNLFLQIVMPNDRLKMIDLVQTIKNQDGEYQFEFDMMTEKMTYRHVLIKLIKQTRKGIAYYQGTLQDLTELHLIMKKYEKSEKEKAIIFESVNEDIIYYDAQMSIISMNHMTDEVTRQQMREMHCGKEIRGQKACDECLVEATLKSQKSLTEEQQIEDRWYETRTYPVFDHETITGVVEVTRDITKERFLRQREKMLDKMKFYLTASKGISIDLNNKIMGLSGYLEIMSSIESIPEAGHTYIHLMKKVVQSIEDITARMSLLNDNPDLSETTLDVIPIIIDAKQMVEDSYNQPIEIEGEAFKRPVYIKGIEEVLFNIFISVLINAVESTQLERQPRVMIKIQEEQLEDHTRLKLIIEDNGIGVKEDQIDKIFEDYYSTKDRTLHAGMGLSTSKQLIEEMGGEIEAHRKDKGLIISLNFKEVEVRNKQYFIHQQEDNDPDDSRYILIIDDEEIIRMLVKEVLTEAGYQVLTASNYLEAENWLKQFSDKIALVFLDMIMPNENGRDIFEKLRQVKDDLRVVVMTGYSEDKDVKFIMVHGGLKVLKKPVSNDKLVEITNQILRGNLESPLNSDKAIKQMSGNKDLYDKICVKFYDKYCHYPDQMRSELAKGDYQALRNKVHAIKGVIGNLGEDKMVELGEIIEEKLVNQQEAEAEIETFIDQLNNVIQYLERIIEK